MLFIRHCKKHWGHIMVWVCHRCIYYAQHMNESSKLLCKAKCYVHICCNIHFLDFPLSTCCGRIMLHPARFLIWLSRKAVVYMLCNIKSQNNINIGQYCTTGKSPSFSVDWNRNIFMWRQYRGTTSKSSC